MYHRTVTRVLPADKDTAFDFLSKEENLPRWAVEFAKEVKRENSLWKVVTPFGELFLKFKADRESGIIDMQTGPNPDQLAQGPTRVISLPDGTSLFIFTLIAEEGDALEGQCAGLEREFDILEKLLKEKAAC